MQLLAHFVGFKIKKKEKRGLFFAQFKEKKVCHDPVTHSEACVKSYRITPTPLLSPVLESHMNGWLTDWRVFELVPAEDAISDMFLTSSQNAPIV